MNTPPVTFRTAGGNTVIWTPHPGKTWGPWTCNGCHLSGTNGDTQHEANGHARECVAI